MKLKERNRRYAKVAVRGGDYYRHHANMVLPLSGLALCVW